MNETKCKRDSIISNPNNETFLLLSTSIKSPILSSTLLSSSAVTAVAIQSPTQLPSPPSSTSSSSQSCSSTSSSVLLSSLPTLSPKSFVMNTGSDSDNIAATTASIVYTCCYQHHRQLSYRNGDIQPNTNKKLMLSVPLQRKRKKVVYNRDFVGAVGIDNCTEGITTDHRFIISHYSCVEKFTKMYTSTAAIRDKDNDQNEINSCVKCTNNSDRILPNDSIVENKANDQKKTRAVSKKFSEKFVKMNVTKINDKYCCASDTIPSNVAIDEKKSECDEFCNRKLEDSDRRSISNNSLISDEGCLTNISPYSSSGEDDEYSRLSKYEQAIKIREKVERSASSDSALGLDDEIIGSELPSSGSLQRRMTLTVTDIPLRSALLPVAEPTSLPESPTMISQQQTEWYSNNPPVAIPSKMILEARIVEIPTPPPMTDTNIKFPSFSSDRMSRRASSQSYVSDIGGNEDSNHVRYVRTPSVVVSDYSDDVVCGITLEELEFFRNQRKSSLGATNAIGESTDCEDLSDLSAASSCSNLNYCGSTISALDDSYTSVSGLQTPERKSSNCSSCSTLSIDDDEEVFSSSLIQALNQQNKKVCKHIKIKKS